MKNAWNKCRSHVCNKCGSQHNTCDFSTHTSTHHNHTKDSTEKQTDRQTDRQTEKQKREGRQNQSVKSINQRADKRSVMTEVPKKVITVYTPSFNEITCLSLTNTNSFLRIP